MTPETGFAELMGRATGGSKGVGGSMHFIDTSLGNIGANAIVGAGLPIAVGAALAFKLQKRPFGALTFFGDGATNIGTFHEALNMAAVWKTPVVFIITNNLYGEYSPQMTTTSTVDLARRADPHGMPGIVVDGQDVDVVQRDRQRGPGAGTRRRRTEPAGDEDLPLSRPLADRPGQVPGAGRARALEGARPHHHPRREARRGGCCCRPRSRKPIRAQTQADIDAAAERAAEAPTLTLEETRQYVYAD